jgi:regulator of sigma E protease
MPDIVLVILAVVFVLGVAINIHEFGHFIVAKYFGMRVEAYSFFGLGPRIWGFKVGHTDYRISAIPLGAYVKLYGDEATAPLEGGESDGEKVPDSELYELRPRWQKFLVMVGGPVMNIILALAIPFGAAMIQGIPSMPAPVVGFVSAGGAAEKAGIKAGDRLVAFDGVENPTWQTVRNDSLVSPEKPIPVTVEREGRRVDVTVVPTKVIENGNSIGELGMLPDVGVEPVVARTVQENSPSAEAGLMSGDALLFINGETVRNSSDVVNRIRENGEKPLTLVVDRGGQRVELAVQPRQSEDGIWRIGTAFGSGKILARDPATLTQAVAFAWNANIEILRLTGKVFGQMFAGERSVKDAGLAGPVGIVQLIATVVTDAGFAGLFSILAVISLNLGVFNLLPIPLLDGGQIMVLGIEKVFSWFGKTLSMAIKEKIQMAGLAVILVLMAFTLFLDISRLF